MVVEGSIKHPTQSISSRNYYYLLTAVIINIIITIMSGIGAVVKVVGSHHCGRGSIPGKSCSFFLIVSLNKGLSLHFMCSDQHVKY